MLKPAGGTIMSTLKPTRVFIVYRYMRENILADIQKDGGTLDTLELSGLTLLRALAAQAVDAWLKAAQASANFTNRAAPNPLLLEGFGDVWEVLMLARQVLQSPPLTQGVLSEDSQGYPKFRALHRQWEELSRLLRQLDPQPGKQEELIPWKEALEEQALLTTLSLRDHLKPFGLTFAEVIREGKTRRKLHGPLSPRFVRQATVPADSLWTREFAAQFIEKIPD
jgi:hypothetical protein